MHEFSTIVHNVMGPGFWTTRQPSLRVSAAAVRYLSVIARLLSVFAMVGSLLLVVPARCQAPNSNARPHPIQIASGAKISDFQWISPDRLIVEIQELNAVSRLEQLDPNTGAEYVIRGSRPSIIDGVASIWPIPGGNRFLLAADIETDHGNWVLGGLDGIESDRRAVADVLRFRGDAAWLPDGSAWAEFDEGDGANFLYLFPNRKGAVGDQGALKPKAYRFTRFETVIGFTDKKHFLMSRRHLPAAVEGKYCQFITYELGRSNTVVEKQRSAIFDSAGAWVRAVSLSPDRKRLCWLTLALSDPIGNSFGGLPGAVADIWLTEIDGANKRFVTRVELPDVRLGAIEHETSDISTGVPHSLSWSIDGKQISYLHNSQIWIVAL